MISQILCIPLLLVIFAWMLYFYGDEERVEKTRELLEKSMVFRAINDGLVLGLSVVGIAFWVIVLTIW